MNYLIPGPNLGHLKSVIAAFKQATDDRSQSLVISIGQRETIENEMGVLAERYTATLTADAPVCGDWIIIAALTVNVLASNHVSLQHVPDQDVPDEYLRARPVCDHCGRDGGARPHLVLRHRRDGHRQQIRQECLKVFAGQDADEVLAYADRLMALDSALRNLEVSDLDTLHASHYLYRLDRLLAVVAAVSEETGWVSRRQSAATGKPASVEHALDVMLANRHITISPKAQAAAQAALDWAKQLTQAGHDLDRYELTLHDITQHEFISYDQTGFAASMIAAHRQAATQVIDRRSGDRPSQYIGRITERSTFTLTVCELRTIGEGEDVKFLHKFVDPHGNRVTWFASTEHALEIGQQVQIKGTVVEHREFRGVPETILTRCVVLPAAAAEQTSLAF
jgi:hypothetical protein